MTTRVAGIMLIVAAVTATAAFAGKPEIVQVTPDTYMIFKEDHKGIFGSLAKMKIGIIKQANEYAASQGKVLIPISCKEKPLGNGPAQWASFEYQFKLVPKDDPEAKRTALGSCPDVVVQSTQSVTADVTLRDDKQGAEAGPGAAGDKSPDLYAELLKLDDLHKRDILTDAEFESEKRKLLNPETVAKAGAPGDKSKDLYTELLKLDDLHTRGILTDAEFEAEKGKLLTPPKPPEEPK